MDEQLAIEPIEAIRAWGVIMGGRLTPVTNQAHAYYRPKDWLLRLDNPWYRPGDVEATCNIGETPGTEHYYDVFPHSDRQPWDRMEALHACGIWGTKHFIPEFGHMISISDSDVRFVFGLVSLWGHVIEHERGYRAERARVKAFFDWQPVEGVDDGTLLALAGQYEVPVTPFTEKVT